MSILTDILAFFLQHLLKICRIRSPAKHKQTKITQQQIHSHVKKVHISRFPVVSNKAIQDSSSVAVNKHTKSFDPFHKTVNERTSPLVGASQDPAILKNISWNKRHHKNLTRSCISIKFCAEVTKRNRDNNELETLKIMQSAIERYLKEKTLHSWASCSRGSFPGVSQLKRNPSQNYTGCILKFLLQRQGEVSLFSRWESNFDAWKWLFSFSLQNCLFVSYALLEWVFVTWHHLLTN